MRRYLVRLANSKYTPEEIGIVRQQVTEQMHGISVDVRNLRISEIAIEFDLFVNDVLTKPKVVAVLAGFGSLLDFRDLTEEGNDRSKIGKKEDVVRVSINLFNAQRYWECHEVLEGLWRQENSGKEKDLQQGIILAASALVHAQKNEPDVCFGMITRALEKLDKWKETNYFSMNITYLKTILRTMLHTRRIFFQSV